MVMKNLPDGEDSDIPRPPLIIPNSIVLMTSGRRFTPLMVGVALRTAWKYMAK
jgi:hypothetical protein